MTGGGRCHRPAGRVLQRPLRLSQSWRLYINGPPRVLRLEILVDGVLKHRSGDPEYDWLEPQLRNRRMRPTMKVASKHHDAKDRKGLMGWLVQQAQDDFPGCQEVRLRALRGRFPGRSLQVRHTWISAAPLWDFRMER